MESIVDRIRILKKVMEGASKMKVLIWLVLIVLCSAAQVLVRYLGISHWIISVVLLVLMVLLPAPVLCKKWDERRSDKK